jgi:hypothetical protein
MLGDDAVGKQRPDWLAMPRAAGLDRPSAKQQLQGSVPMSVSSQPDYPLAADSRNRRYPAVARRSGEGLFTTQPTHSLAAS